MERYPGVGFGLTLVSGCRIIENSPEFKAYKKKHLRKMRKREILAQITERIDTYADFFQQFGYPCPYAYAVPEIDSSYLKEGLSIAAETVAEFGEGTIEGLEIF